MTNPVPSGDAAAHAHRAFLGLMLIALVVLGAGIGLRDPWPSDEPRFALSARQMVDSGDWLFPHRGRELYSDKPPMLMWTQAAAYEATRNWRIAFLLPSLLAGLATLVLIHDLGRRLWNPRVGFLAAAALLATFQFVYQVKRAQIDPLVVLWITLANWGLLRHFLRGPDWRAYAIGCFAAGLGVITKGVGVLALAMFIPYLFARWRGWPDVMRGSGNGLRWAGGLVLFPVAISLWVVPMVLAARAHGTPEYAAYVHDILFHQTARRYLDSWDHPHSALFYLPIVLFSWFPLSLAYPGVFPRWREALVARDARVLLPLAWVVLVIAFFCVPSGKRDVYIMPALPMLVLALAPYLDGLIQSRWLRLAAFAITAVVGAVLFAGGIAGYLGSPIVERLAGREIAEAGGAPWVVAIAIGGAMLACAGAFRAKRGVHAMLTGLAAMWIVWSVAGYPIFNAGSSASEVMRRAGEAIGPDAALGLVAWKEQNLLMADRPARDFGFGESWPDQFSAARRWQDEDPAHRWIFLIEDAMGDCVDRSRAIDVGRANRREYWVFRADAAVPGCVPEVSDESDADGR